MKRFGLDTPKIHFDANAIRNFFRPRVLDEPALAALRGRVRALVATDELRVVLTQPVSWELTSIIADREFGGLDRYRDALRFYAHVGHRAIMLDEYKRQALELRTRRRVRDDEVFYSGDPVEIVRTCSAPAWIEGAGGQTRDHKSHERDREARARTDVVAALEKRYGADWRSAVDRELSNDDWHISVSQMVRTEMRRAARRARLRIRSSAWPDPQTVPTFWFGESFLAAKARFVFLNEARTLTSNSAIRAMPDLLDVTHFRDAAYADVLVSDDENFREVARSSRTSLSIVGLREFADEVT